jgi:CDP-diacylglycerol--glycerol-3-phosphate 3-phosphatidyltransferase
MAVIGAAALLAAGGGWMGAQAGSRAALLWIGPAAAVALHVLIPLRRLLPLNQTPGSPGVRPTLGLANWITLFRAGLIAGLAGWVFQPSLAAAGGWREWLPGAAYLAAAVLDGVDGRVARATRRVTCLGERLDGICDAAGLLVASALAVGLGRAPAAYLGVGAGVYVLQAAVWVRRKSGRTAAPVAPRPGARLIAGIEMAFAGLILLPVFAPPAVRPAAWVMIAAIALSLARDWRIVCAGPGPGGRPAARSLEAFERFLADGLPLALRAGIPAAAAVFLAADGFGQNAPAERTAAAAGIALAALCAIGVAARVSAVLLSVLSAFGATALDDAGLAVLAAGALALAVTGAGRFRLWQPEDRVLLRDRGGGRPCRGGGGAPENRLS